MLDGALAWVGCDARALLPGGDHTIGIGAVHAAEIGAPGTEPLVWFRGDYGLARMTALHVVLGVALVAVEPRRRGAGARGAGTAAS